MTKNERFARLRQELLNHARRWAPKQHQDHEDAINDVICDALKAKDFSIEFCLRRLGTRLRALRADRRRPSRCGVVESQIRKDGTGERDSEPDAPHEALDRLAMPADEAELADILADACTPAEITEALKPRTFKSGSLQPEKLAADRRWAVSLLRRAFETELSAFWLPSGLEPPWAAWARRISEASGRDVDAARVAEAMRSERAVARRGRQRLRLGDWQVDDQPVPSTELTQRRIGALFTFCHVAASDTQALDSREATESARARDAFKHGYEGEPVYAAEDGELVGAPPQQPRSLAREGYSALATAYFPRG